MKKLFLFIGIFLISLSSCVNMLRGVNGDPKKRVLNIGGYPEGATVYLGEDSIGISPMRYAFEKLPKSQELKIVKKGYKEQYIWVERKANSGWVVVSWTPCIVGIIPFAGISCISTLMDYKKGSFYDLKDSEIEYKLIKQ